MTEQSVIQRCQQIVENPTLSPEQKRHFLALEAENMLPYPTLSNEASLVLRISRNQVIHNVVYKGHDLHTYRR